MTGFDPDDGGGSRGIGTTLDHWGTMPSRPYARRLCGPLLAAGAAAALALGATPVAQAAPPSSPSPAQTQRTAAPVVASSAGVAVDPRSGTAYQADPQGNRVLTFAPSDRGYAPTGSIPTGAGPVSVVVDPASGTVCTANQTGRSITTIAPTGTVVRTTPVLIALSLVTVDGTGAPPMWQRSPPIRPTARLGLTARL